LPLEARLLTGLAIAVAVAYWATPLAIRVADRLDFYDKPSGYKGHARATPYLGGTALVAGFLFALLLFASDADRTLPVVVGVVVMWAVGTIDDRRNVAWWLRVLVEVGLAAMLWAVGAGWDLGLGGPVDLGLTALWLVAVTNAFNLFDNMDGQSATMGLVTSLGLAALGIATDSTWLALAGVALAGACFGFLPHNLLSQPARIFLGDGGSMPLGFAVASLAMIGAGNAAPAWQGVALGLLLVGVPTLDTTLVVVSRRRRGLSVLTGGRDHLTHRARQRLRTAFAVAVALGSAQIVLSLLAVAAARGSTTVLSGVAVVYLVLLGVTVALVDTRIPAVPPDAPAPAPVETRATPRRFERVPREAPLVVIFGVGAGISPLLQGYYDEAVWGPLALGLLVCLLAVGIARAPRLSVPGWLALAGLAGLGLWSLLSALWADSVEQAVVSGNRTLMLAAGLGLLLLLIRDRRTALWAVGAFAATTVVVELVMLARLLGPHAAGQFLGGRLDHPLGYINAQATFAILALWPLLALAEQRRSAVAAGFGLAGTVLSGGFILMSESRGAALALLGSALIVLLVAPGRLRRGVALVLGGAGLLVVSSRVLDIYRAQSGLTDGIVHTGITALIIAAVVCGVVWGGLVALERATADVRRAQARRALSITFAAGAVVLVLVAVIRADSVGHQIRAQYDAFVHLSVDQGGEQTASRLLTGAGNRYDYWRIAADTWTDHPLIGVGAGNYDEPYFLARATTEDVRQPHSLVLQAMSELGIPGLALVLLLFGAVGWAAARARRAAVTSRAERLLLVAALGTFAAWGIHTQVDWIHLLPGITGGALIAAAVLLRRDPVAQPAPRRLLRPVPRSLVAAAVALPVAIAGVSLSRQVLAQHYRGEAQHDLAQKRAHDALADADRALRLDSRDLETYYAKAAAFARLGDADSARRTLEEARRREPGDFLTYALLGDLSVRLRNFTVAQTYYRQALARNPRDPSLQALARDPRVAITP
jgi:UDP-GlcNAc:undecaprenyl-phosphate GlcNAc-1-phosphate transferase